MGLAAAVAALLNSLPRLHLKAALLKAAEVPGVICVVGRGICV